MEMEKYFMPMMGMIMIAGVLQQILPAAPIKDQCCPLCTECFYTYDELYTHFVTAHPATPINIIWE